MKIKKTVAAVASTNKTSDSSQKSARLTNNRMKRQEAIDSSDHDGGGRGAIEHDAVDTSLKNDAPQHIPQRRFTVPAALDTCQLQDNLTLTVSVDADVHENTA